MWTTVNKWQQMEEIYNTTPFVTLKKEDISNDLHSVFQKASDLVAWSSSNLVAKHMLEKIEHYQKMLPHILALANSAIKHRHWTRLFVTVGQPYDEEPSFTLTQLKAYGVFNRNFFGGKNGKIIFFRCRHDSNHIYSCIGRICTGSSIGEYRTILVENFIWFGGVS